MTDKNIAFIGLGIMGSPMAANLVKAGHHVTGFNLEQSAIDALVSAGGHGATSIADAAQGWHIEELHTEEGRLDEVFRSITMPDTAAAAKS